MTRSITIVQTLIATVFLLLLIAPTNAGIVVDVQNGIVQSFTYDGTLSDPNSPTTVYFYEGSYNTQVTNGVNFTFANNTDPYLMALQMNNELNDYLNTNSLDTNVAYAFDNHSSPQDRAIDYAYADDSNLFWQYNYENGVQDGQTYISPQNQLHTLYYASDVAPVSGVPEPSTAIAMGLLGVVGFAGNRRRRRQVSAA